MGKTAIEWATDVWNPFTGCDLVSPGCAHCYALDAAASLKRREGGRVAKARREGKPDPKTRYQHDGDPRTSGPGFGFTVHWDKIEKPPSFTRGGRVFVNSMSDVFHEEAPIEAVVALWRVFAERPDVNFLVLTKRPERMKAMVESIPVEWEVATDELLPHAWPLPNVWLGVTIENRRFVDRADLLRDTPAAVRFISAEPLLGPLIFDSWEEDGEGERWPAWADGARLPDLDLTGLDWVIAGGESGPRHRRFDPQWARDLRDACQKSDTAFFFKQHGGAKPTSGGRELDGRTWDELPVPDGEVLAAAA